MGSLSISHCSRGTESDNLKQREDAAAPAELTAATVAMGQWIPSLVWQAGHSSQSNIKRLFGFHCCQQAGNSAGLKRSGSGEKII
jgi:hypothetical protein